MNWCRYGITWTAAIGLLVTEILIDHGWSVGCDGALPRDLWFGLHVANGLGFAFATVWATRSLSRLVRTLVVVASAALAGVVYLAIVLYYAFTYRCDFY